MKLPSRILKYTAEYLMIAGALLLLYKFGKPLLKQWPGYDAVYHFLYTRIYEPFFEPWMNKVVKEILFNEMFLIATGVIMLLELFFPAKPNQKIFTVSLAQDLVWVFVQAMLAVAFIRVWSNFLTAYYKEHLYFLTMTGLIGLPKLTRFIIGMFVGDFIGWFHHWVRHKVPWFWQFHTIHHSQRNINMYTELRYHVIEYLVSTTVKTFPVMVIGGIENYNNIVYFVIFDVWFTRFYHSNIKTDLGPLRYVFVTPQSHRVHHSIEQRHQDKNFGVWFSIWDYMFGTQWRKYDEYPDTGIHDHHFPHETTVRGLSLLWLPVLQHIYPFRAIARSLAKKKKTAPSPVEAAEAMSGSPTL